MSDAKKIFISGAIDDVDNFSPDAVGPTSVAEATTSLTGVDEINYESLAETVLSMAYIDKESFIPWKIISFNFGIDFIYQQGGILHHDGQSYDQRNDMVTVLASRLREIIKPDRSNLEFVRTDSVTKTVFVVTKELVNKIKNPDNNLKVGNLILNYYKIWYQTKCLSRVEDIRPELVSKIFSKVELKLIDENLIPIFVMPEKMDVLRRAMDDAISVSPIADYVYASRGYNIYGKFEPVKMWWVPVVIAQKYLREEDIMKVRSEKVLRTLLVEANLLYDPDIQRLGEERIIFDDELIRSSISDRTNEYIKEKSLFLQKDLTAGLLEEENAVQEPAPTPNLSRTYEVTLADKVNRILSDSPSGQAMTATISSDLDHVDSIEKSLSEFEDIGDLGSLFKKK